MIILTQPCEPFASSRVIPKFSAAGNMVIGLSDSSGVMMRRTTMPLESRSLMTSPAEVREANPSANAVNFAIVEKSSMTPSMAGNQRRIPENAMNGAGYMMPRIGR